LGEPKTSFLEDLLDFSKNFPSAVSRPFSFRQKKKNVEFLESKNDKLSSIAGNHKKKKNYRLPLCTFPKKQEHKIKKDHDKSLPPLQVPQGTNQFCTRINQ
jgi:hypothetical protein